MDSVREGNIVVARLDDGEEILSKINDIIKINIINSGIIVGAVGMLKNAEVGYYNGKEYVFKKLEAPHEIVSLQGNISRYKDMPFIHLHCSLANENNDVFGGHLKEGYVVNTVEIALLKLVDVELMRQPDSRTGLTLLRLRKLSQTKVSKFVRKRSYSMELDID